MLFRSGRVTRDTTGNPGGGGSAWGPGGPAARRRPRAAGQAPPGQAPPVQAEPAEAGYAGYQLIRNVLAAYAECCSFCVLHDERRPDLREAWFQVMAAVKSAEMRVRCKVLTWQELASMVPGPLQEFLDRKYGITTVRRPTSMSELDAFLDQAR